MSFPAVVLPPGDDPIKGVVVIRYPASADVNEVVKLARKVSYGSTVILPSDKDERGEHVWDIGILNGPEEAEKEF